MSVYHSIPTAHTQNLPGDKRCSWLPHGSRVSLDLLHPGQPSIGNGDNLINNSQQVHSYDSVNTWDADYPCGGNYWSDYYGEDNFGGPKQDQPGTDGIVDKPYGIDDINRDRYPLMEPWSSPPMVRIFIRLVELWDMSKGRENSLTSKLYDAIHLFNKENENGAIQKIVDFTHEVETLEDADQKANQMFNLLSTVMKSMKDTAEAVVRNMK